MATRLPVTIDACVDVAVIATTTANGFVVPIVAAGDCVHAGAGHSISCLPFYLHPSRPNAVKFKSTSGYSGSLPVVSAVSESSGRVSHGSRPSPTGASNTCRSRIRVYIPLAPPRILPPADVDCVRRCRGRTCCCRRRRRGRTRGERRRGI
jgi:hypothetical protein